MEVSLGFGRVAADSVHQREVSQAHRGCRFPDRRCEWGTWTLAAGLGPPVSSLEREGWVGKREF